MLVNIHYNIIYLKHRIRFGKIHETEIHETEVYEASLEHTNLRWNIK